MEKIKIIEKLKKALKMNFIVNWVFIGLLSSSAIACLTYLISLKFKFETNDEIGYGIFSSLWFLFSICVIVYEVYASVVPMLKDQKLLKKGIYEQLDAKVITQYDDHKIGSAASIATIIKDINTGKEYKFYGLVKTEIGKQYKFFYLKNSEIIIFEPMPKKK